MHDYGRGYTGSTKEQRWESSAGCLCSCAWQSKIKLRPEDEATEDEGSRTLCQSKVKGLVLPWRASQQQHKCAWKNEEPEAWRLLREPGPLQTGPLPPLLCSSGTQPSTTCLSRGNSEGRSKRQAALGKCKWGLTGQHLRTCREEEAPACCYGWSGSGAAGAIAAGETVGG